MKKSQITIFMVLGLIFLVSLFFLIEIKSNVSQSRQSAQASNMGNAIGLKKNINQYIESSIKNSMDTGVSTTEFDQLDYFLERSLENNIDFSSFAEGRTISRGPIWSDVSLSDDRQVANVHVIIPLNVSSGSNHLSFSDFYLSYKLASESELNNDGNGMLTSNFSVHSSDLYASLSVNENSVALMPDGTPVDTINIKIKDLRFIDPGQFRVFGAYEFEPSGAQFYPPAKIMMHYDQSMLPPGTDEQNIVLMHVLADGTLAPMSSTIDTANNVITAYVYHFSGVVMAVQPGISNFVTCMMNDRQWDGGCI